MAGWAVEFAQEVLNSEAKTKDTWSDLSQQLRTAVADINKILEGKSQTKLAFAETGDLITVTSTLNRKVSLNLDSHARTISVLVDRTAYNFNLTQDPQKLVGASSPPLPGVNDSDPVGVTTLVQFVIKAVVDLRG
jgi:hypothetical protein